MVCPSKTILKVVIVKKITISLIVVLQFFNKFKFKNVRSIKKIKNRISLAIYMFLKNVVTGF